MPEHGSDGLMDSVIASMKEDARQQQEKDFTGWCDQLAQLPDDFELQLKDGFLADLELQPFRWMDLGLDLLQSSKGTVSLSGGDERPGLFWDSYLAYPVFQMGAEIFLKGMWLCQFADCRCLGDHGYLDATMRQSYSKRLKDLGHDLLKITAANRKIPEYHGDAKTMRFLKIVDGVVRQFYFPLYQADKKGSHWAHSRYPKRFYKDAAQQGRSDAFQSYPQQWLVVKLFAPMEKRVDHLWQLRAGLLAQHKERRQNATP